MQTPTTMRYEDYPIFEVSREAASFPRQWLELEDMPDKLYVKCKDMTCLSLLNTYSIAVIGTRQPSELGAKNAREIARMLAAEGHPIVSGLADGCDTQAHWGALDAQGFTIAVLVQLDRVYPASNADLAMAILESGGLLISENPPGATFTDAAYKLQFIRRDRLQAALAHIVIAVQSDHYRGASGTRKHGTMYTCEFASKYQRAILVPKIKVSDRRPDEPARDANNKLRCPDWYRGVMYLLTTKQAMMFEIPTLIEFLKANDLLCKDALTPMPEPAYPDPALEQGPASEPAPEPAEETSSEEEEQEEETPGVEDLPLPAPRLSQIPAEIVAGMPREIREQFTDDMPAESARELEEEFNQIPEADDAPATPAPAREAEARPVFTLDEERRIAAQQHQQVMKHLNADEVARYEQLKALLIQQRTDGDQKAAGKTAWEIDNLVNVAHLRDMEYPLQVEPEAYYLASFRPSELQAETPPANLAAIQILCTTDNPLYWHLLSLLRRELLPENDKRTKTSDNTAGIITY